MLLLPANPRLPDIYNERACGRRYPGVRELFVPSISARAIAAEGTPRALHGCDFSYWSTKSVAPRWPINASNWHRRARSPGYDMTERSREVTMTDRGSSFGNGDVLAVAAVCRKRPPSVPSYDDGTGPSHAGGAARRRRQSTPAASGWNRSAGPVLGHRWGHHRDQQNSLAACRHRCARTGSPLGPAVEMGIGSIMQGPDRDGPDQARTFIRPHGGRMFPA